MVHKKFAVAVLAAAVGACAQMPEQGGVQDDLQQQEKASTATTAATDHPKSVQTAPPPTDIWERLRRGFTLERHTDNPRVKDYIAYFSRNEGYMARVTERSRRYIFHIVEQLEDAGLPLELALLPIVESAYDPFAYSHASAGGMWQFMPATGRHFGLQQNWWRDDRRDVAESTRAAIQYFAYLSDEFNGDWELALAAYNGGEGRVRRAVERNQRRGQETDFWHLDLPRETERYVPQLLALAEVVARSDYYRVPLHEVANKPYYASVDVGSQIDLAQAAKLAGIEIEELHLLNPEFKRWATAPNGDHHLLIPVGKRKQFKAALAQLPENQRVSWLRYEIARGDTLSTIARRYETTVAAIRQANKLRGNRIRAGKTLLIPSASPANGRFAYTLDQRVADHRSSGEGSKTSYTVQPGDTLWEISRSLDVSVRQLASWNDIAPSDTLRPGHKLVAWAGADRDTGNKTRYTVRRGDTLWDISRSLGVTVRQLVQWNDMSRGDTLRPGHQLVAYTGATGGNRKLSYQVRSGDSLYRIASEFGIDIDDILRWNNISKSSYLQPGQQLTLFINGTEG